MSQLLGKDKKTELLENLRQCEVNLSGQIECYQKFIFTFIMNLKKEAMHGKF